MKRDRRAFWFGLGLGLFVFLTGAGVLMVDYQGRKLSFGDSTPVARLDRGGTRTTLTVKAFGGERSWDVTGAGEMWKTVRAFLCLPEEREDQKDWP
ncbi:hypothetical protein [Acutalibacter caecimuris]|uniref:hypothetical protein n=1 Tax=Acutalibacter caecimuris TaxID=3093657 RepID=UPI002AC8BEEB|nr:hypothetical protein [Acutalibacter sp. M00118]